MIEQKSTLAVPKSVENDAQTYRMLPGLCSIQAHLPENSGDLLCPGNLW